ncbi:OmpH family outer membrane protein [Pelagibaculum spongiae]|uniref:OmpH family outer membrane protein n=1 Tax=Pelagibaculum spongiae TaxID=2080658 RepID=A0A2V1GT82_9GAMM|nr:OmpH family outer membrane protein [Pelagibaculum spongiae]PVZ64905.1 hypothetical protein DC094_18745 [Pelagibaculum spongiae]
MKKFVQLVCSSALLLAASSVNAVELGVINFSRVLQESQMGKELTTLLQSKEQEAQQAVQKMEQEIRKVFSERAQKAQQEFELQKDLLSAQQLDSEQQKLVQAINAMQASAQRELAGRRNQQLNTLGVFKNTEQAKVGEQVRALLKKLAKEKKLDLILNETGVAVIADESLDITDLVIERLNASKAAK